MRSHGIQGWEDGNFPILCKDCLGDDTMMRMIKEKYGWDCKVCLSPFTTFRWAMPPSANTKGSRYRRTEICQTCSRLRNLCQSCLLDIEYGLPAQVRDKVLGEEVDVPEQEANRNYFIAYNAKRLEKGDKTLIDYEKTDPAAKIVLEALAKKYHKTGNAASDPLPCSFYAKGKCKRGAECPYKHVLVAEKPASLKTYHNRYYGKEDPRAEGLVKLLDKSGSSGGGLLPPSDRTIHSFYIMGIKDPLTSDRLKAYFDNISPIKNVNILPPDGTTAIITFVSRQAAENASSQAIGNLEIDGIKLQAYWAKSKLKGEKMTIQNSANDTIIKKEVDEGDKDDGDDDDETVDIPLPPGAHAKSNYKTQNPSLYR